MNKIRTKLFKEVDEQVEQAKLSVFEICEKETENYTNWVFATKEVKLTEREKQCYYNGVKEGCFKIINHFRINAYNNIKGMK